MRKTLLLVALFGLLAQTAKAAPILYDVVLNGANEFPSNASPGTGTALVTIDDVAHTLDLDVTFTGLLGPTTASHIHCCTAVPLTGNVGVATQTPSFIGFPLGVTSGAYVHTFDTTDPGTWNSPFITANGGTALGAEAALVAGAAAGRAYLNIHTQVFPGGEIRGFLVPHVEAVPEPASLMLLAPGLALFAARRWRKR